MRKTSLASVLVGAFALGPVISIAGCGGDGTTSMQMTPPPDAMAVCTQSLPAGAKASFSGDNGACTEVTTSLAHHDATDIVPDGYLALGPAMFVDGNAGPFPHGIDLVIPADLGKAQKGAPSSRIVVVGKRADGVTAVLPASNVVYESYYKRLHFHAASTGTFQAAIGKDAGTSIKRHFTYRAIGGVSMGGIGSSTNFWRKPDRYDAIAVMGADPGPDLTYTLGIMHDWFFAGFCSAASGKLGQLCAPDRKPMVDQFEKAMDFEHLIYQQGDGVGLHLFRSTYIRAFRDLSRAFGNAAYASDPNSTAPFSTFLPPGVPLSTLAQPNAVSCDPKNAVRLKGFYDWQYNPDAEHDVITFCDGGDTDAAGGVFDPAQPQTDPTQILLAVDVNGNGKRDSGEPVLLQGSEHLYDFGTDGIPDEKEAGYDAVTNPDPAHDDYHWYWNPKGTEKNWRYDMGEKFDDFGVDGVKGKGCPVGATPPNGVGGCYDFGEGNGKFDYTPNSANWYAHDPRTLLENTSAETLSRLNVYYDAGIRDFLNAQVSTNSLVGALNGKNQNVRVWDGFPAMNGNSPSHENRFKITDVDFTQLGRHAYVRYGNPDTSENEVMQTGDGRHVGTIDQAIHRGQMLFYFVSHTWPGGDYDTDVGPGHTVNTMFTAKNGRVTPYSVVLPPGYDDDKNATKGYPVLYLLHGYGMDPMGLASVAIIGQNAMINSSVPEEKRLQKMIIVLVDGKCRPGGDVKNEPVSPDGDRCEEGTFYGEHADGTAKAESHLLELQAIIDSTYRVKAPADLDVVQ